MGLQGLAIAHSEILAGRTTAAVTFTLNAAKLAWAAQWPDTVVMLSMQTLRTKKCTPLTDDPHCAEKAMAFDLAVLAYTSAGKHADAAEVLRQQLAAGPTDFARAHDLWRVERLAVGESVILLTPPSTFNRCFNSDGERASSK